MEALSEFCWTIAAKIESVHLHIKTDDNKCNSNESLDAARKFLESSV
jgi:hypothetical protein